MCGRLIATAVPRPLSGAPSRCASKLKATSTASVRPSPRHTHVNRSAHLYICTSAYQHIHRHTDRQTDRTGQDRTGQDRTGQDRTGPGQDRQRDRETQRHRDTETQRNRDNYRETETQRHRDTETQRHRNPETQRHRDTETHTHTHTLTHGHTHARTHPPAHALTNSMMTILKADSMIWPCKCEAPMMPPHKYYVILRVGGINELEMAHRPSRKFTSVYISFQGNP